MEKMSGSTRIVVYDTLDAEKVGEKVGENLIPNQILILKYISKNEFITITELSDKIGIATKNIENNLAKLKKIGILERIGPDKGGHWGVNTALLESYKIKKR